MAYTTREAIEANVQPDWLAQALDDDGDGVEDAGLLDRIISTAATEVDGYLATRYATPVSPTPPVVATAALALACETLWQRRGHSGQANPWADRAEAARGRLEALRDGKESLGPGYAVRATTTNSIETEPSRIHDPAGRLPF